MQRREFLLQVGASSAMAFVADFVPLLRSIRGVARPSVLQMSDYVLSAAQEGVWDQAREMLLRRPNTCRVKLSPPDIASFIEHLASVLPDRSALECAPTSGGSAAPALPVGTLYIISHATSEGILRIRLKPTGQHESTFSDIQDAIDYNRLVIPDRLVTDGRPAEAPAPRVRVVGCRIGASRWYMQGLWTAFNNPHVELVAPKHFDVFYGGGKRDYIKGTMEYLAYSFEMTTACELDKRDGIVSAFKAESDRILSSLTNVSSADDHPGYRAWRHFEAADIPLTQWQAWIPADAARQLRVSPKTVRWIPHKVKFAHPVEGNPELHHNFGEYRHYFRAYRFVFPDGGSHARKEVLARRTAVSDFLKAGADFQPGYSGGPVWEWYGYPTYGQFIDAFSWGVEETNPCMPTPPSMDGRDTGRWWGVQHVYICIVPIRDANGNLLLNYTGGTTSEHQFGLDEFDDPQQLLFRRVTSV
jgi:hypothetical protein